MKALNSEFFLKCIIMIKIIHFNDVYDIEEENGMGGVASFFTALQKHSQDDPLTLFSGDLFSPSHRIPISNLLYLFSLKFHKFILGNK